MRGPRFAPGCAPAAPPGRTSVAGRWLQGACSGGCERAPSPSAPLTSLTRWAGGRAGQASSRRQDGRMTCVEPAARRSPCWLHAVALSAASKHWAPAGVRQPLWVRHQREAAHPRLVRPHLLPRLTALPYARGGQGWGCGLVGVSVERAAGPTANGAVSAGHCGWSTCAPHHEPALLPTLSLSCLLPHHPVAAWPHVSRPCLPAAPGGRQHGCPGARGGRCDCGAPGVQLLGRRHRLRCVLGVA